MNKIFENEIIDSVKNNIKDKLISPVYGVFIVSWSIFHWEFIYTMFFVDQDKIWQELGLLRNEYLKLIIFDPSSLYWWAKLILPFILTYFIIWKFPKWISIPAFTKHEEYKSQKRIIEIRERRKVEEEIIKTLKVTEEKIGKEKEIKEKEKEIKKIDPIADWEQEYYLFRSNSLYRSFMFITESIYRYNGKIEDIGYSFKIPPDILAYSHTNDLISFDKNKKDIELTDKGKYFVKKFQEDRNH